MLICIVTVGILFHKLVFHCKILMVLCSNAGTTCDILYAIPQTERNDYSAHSSIIMTAHFTTLMHSDIFKTLF